MDNLNDELIKLKNKITEMETEVLDLRKNHVSISEYRDLESRLENVLDIVLEHFKEQNEMMQEFEETVEELSDAVEEISNR